MTSDKFVVSINLYPEFGNYDYIIVCDFGGRRLSGYEVIEASEAPLGSQEAKNPVWIWTGLTHLQYRDRPYAPVHQWQSFSLRNCETFINPWLTFRVASGPLSRFRLHPPHPTSSNFYLCSGLHSAREKLKITTLVAAIITQDDVVSQLHKFGCAFLSHFAFLGSQKFNLFFNSPVSRPPS